MRFTIAFYFLCCSLSVFSQLKGRVTDEKNTPLEMVTVVIKDTKKGTYTNKEGYFSFDLADGNYTLLVSFIGFKSQERQIVVRNGVSKFQRFKMIEETESLEEVLITAKIKTKAQIIREKSYAVETVDMKDVKNISTDINAVLGKVSGVNIRESGGLGSDFSLSLNGFLGNQIRTFIDGIPMHYFGSSLSLNNFPSNLVENIEVYKGVVPIHLSSDALGGAINVTTNKSQTNFLDASYSIGSFDTHRFSINGQHRANTGFTVRLKSFYNYSDNNYEVPIFIRNSNTGKLSEQAINLKRFHDAYDSKMIWTEFGVTGKSYADELMLGVLFSENYNEIQQSPNAIGESSFPYGEVNTEEEKIITNLSYKKKDIIQNLSASAYFVGVFSDRMFNDVSDYKHDWFGNPIFNSNTSGEMGFRKTKLNLNETNYLANINGEYSINNNNSIATNYSFNYFNIEGEDRFNPQNRVQFEEPSTLKKQIISFSYTNNIRDKFKTSVFGKYYLYDIETVLADYLGLTKEPIEKSLNDFGYGLATSYQINGLQIKASYEKAFRFPEVVELFGNGMEVIPQPNLQPEKSDNFNLGFLYKNKSNLHKYWVSANAFLRNGIDYIFPTSRGLVTEYKNTKKAITKGIDFSINYNYKNTFLVSGNGSFYDKRNNERWKDDAQTIENILYDIRFPNEPYLTGNISISYKKENMFYSDDSFVTSLRGNYVHEFYYKWENLASENKATVPSQFTNDLEFVYSLQQQRYNFSLGITNIWNKTVYDNFKQTKPGRAFNLKIRYFIN